MDYDITRHISWRKDTKKNIEVLEIEDIFSKQEEELRRTYVDEINKKGKEILYNYYWKNKLTNEGIDLKNLSQSFLYPKNDKEELFLLNFK